VPELEAASRTIAAAVDSDDEPELHRRITQLHVTGTRPPRSQRKRLALAFAALAGLAGVAALVVEAAVYHGTYVERMTAEKKTNERLRDGRQP